MAVGRDSYVAGKTISSAVQQFPEFYDRTAQTAHFLGCRLYSSGSCDEGRKECYFVGGFVAPEGISGMSSSLQRMFIEYLSGHTVMPARR